MQGPDTAGLAFRVGLHSGPVTGGVVRCDNARFQLFGDVSSVSLERECNVGLALSDLWSILHHSTSSGNRRSIPRRGWKVPVLAIGFIFRKPRPIFSLMLPKDTGSCPEKNSSRPRAKGTYLESNGFCTDRLLPSSHIFSF